MTGKMDWRKARKFKDAEEKFADGTVLRSGRVVRHAPPQSSLEDRAKYVEQQWLRRNGLDEKLRKKKV